MKNFLTLIFVLISAQQASATCKLLPATTLTCKLKVGNMEIQAPAQKTCDEKRDADLWLVNDEGDRVKIAIAYDVEAVFKGESEALDVSYNTKKGDESTRMEQDCKEN